MRKRSISILAVLLVFTIAALAQPPAKPGRAETPFAEGSLPEGSVMKDAVLQYADGSSQPIEYALTPDGTAVMDGDIVISVDSDGRAQIAKDFERLWAERNAFGKAYMINGSSFRWFNNTMPYVIEVDTAFQENEILIALDHIEDRTPVRFVERTNEPDYVAFVSAEDVNCRSAVGRQGGRQLIQLEFGCFRGQVIHEVGHALGMWHEQSRSDRDNSVIVHWNNIETNPDARPNFQIRPGFWRGPYDFNSIMNYGSDFFSRNGQPTLTRLDGSTWTAQRTALTTNDATGIGDMYKRVRASISRDCVGFINWCDFTGYSSHGVQPATSWRWTIEDGNNVIIKTGGFVSHQFQNAGPNYVFLEIVDSQGDRATAQTIVDLTGCTMFRDC